MKELTLQQILHIQQKDFVARLKFSLDYYLEKEWETVNLSCLNVHPYCHVSFHRELINILLSQRDEEELHDFSQQQAGKFNDCLCDKYINYKVGKIGEEAVKACLGDFITKVDYETYPHGDGGVDFCFSKNQSIGIQVKTKCLRRVNEREVYENNLNDNDIQDILINFYTKASSYIDKMNWKIQQKEIEKK